MVRTRSLAAAALIAALMAGTSWLSAQLPASAVPVTPQIFFVILAALLLPPRWALASMATYVALGAIGLPVFSGGKGGLAVVVGPTGGYLIGFVLAAFVGALVRDALKGTGPRGLSDGAAAAVAVTVAYTVGAVQLAVVLNLTPVQAIATGIAPFVVFDAVKAAIAVVVAGPIARARRQER